jgi:heat shock protein HspQ
MGTVSVAPRFESGQIVAHRRSGFRGVIVSVDERYQGTDEWYEQAARSRPPKDRPWYHVLVHDTMHEAYVAERNLEPVDQPEPVEHPLVWVFFDEMVDGHYVRNRLMN